MGCPFLLCFTLRLPCVPFGVPCVSCLDVCSLYLYTYFFCFEGVGPLFCCSSELISETLRLNSFQAFSKTILMGDRLITKLQYQRRVVQIE
jgi:hypothetical protein